MAVSELDGMIDRLCNNDLAMYLKIMLHVQGQTAEKLQLA